MLNGEGGGCVLEESTVVLDFEEFFSVYFEDGWEGRVRWHTGDITDQTNLGCKKSQHSAPLGIAVKHAPNLKQHLWSHTEEAVHNPESEYHRHRIDESRGRVNRATLKGGRRD
jgi:hypothetical protein